MKFRRLFVPGLMALALSACQNLGPNICIGHDCVPGGGTGSVDGGRPGDHSHDPDQPHQHDHVHTKRPQSRSDGLIVGAVVNAEGRSSLEAYERWRYADQLASRILKTNPELSGSVDSYQYLSKRVGKPLGLILKKFRLDGELDDSALETLKSAQLRRRYLLLASIQPEEESVQLKPQSEPVVGPVNRSVHDYHDEKRLTVLFASVRVQIYDTFSGRKIFDDTIRSDDGGRILAAENSYREYVGNSIFASISNSIANGLTGSAGGAYPAPPERDDVLVFLWERVAEKLPGDVF